MTQKLIIQTKNPKKFRRFQEEYAGNILLEISKMGNENELLYAVCEFGYEPHLWERPLAERIGSTCWRDL